MSLPVMPTRIMIVGGGGREHALAWKLAAEPGVNEVVVAPGSEGIAAETRVHSVPVPEGSNEAIVALARSRSSELVVIGPEAPLAAGLADALIDAGIAVFGPTRDAARLETSKAFCHEVAASAGVPMAVAVVASTRDEAVRAIDPISRRGAGFVIKEDGLAAGKGVTVFEADDDRAAAEAIIEDVFDRDPAARIVVEERLTGREASVIAICDGQRSIALPAARDHKRLLDGDTGPNTGGMGAYSPLPDLDGDAVEGILRTIHLPLLAEMARRGSPFRGFLYAGLMLTADGPRLLECNARLGDPEAQVILPRLAGPLGPILRAAAAGRLPGELPPRLPAAPTAAVGIVLAAPGYPGTKSQGAPISGLDEAATEGALVFHAGTRRAADGRWETNGGRILTVVGRRADLDAARTVAERAADTISFDGVRRRHDIATDLAVPQPIGARR
jgi:phosphoribosylamine--glycine ligase